MRTQIRTDLSAKSALTLGHTEHGTLLVDPTPEQLSALPVAHRVALADYVQDPHRSGGRSLTVEAPGWAGVVAALTALADRAEAERVAAAAKIEHERASYRQILAGGYYVPGTLPLEAIKYPDLWTYAPNYSQRDEETKRLWLDVEALRLAQAAQIIREADQRLEYDVVDNKLTQPIRLVLDAANNRNFDGMDLVPRATSFSQRLAAEQSAHAAAIERANHEALLDVVTRLGDASQRDRFLAGVLPERELATLVETELFAPLGQFAPYREISEQDVADHCDCSTDDVKFTTSTEEPEELDAEEFATLQGIRKAAPAGAVVEYREHMGYSRHATSNSDPDVRRNGVRVTIGFGGRKWSREYAI